MKYSEFKNRVLSLPIITINDIAMLSVDKQTIRNQMKRWQDRGLIIKLRKGSYILNFDDRKINPSIQFIANQLYPPSYISLEYALSFYGLIPERVVDVTSVTTKKTARFKNEFGNFTYQHLKPSAYSGFKAVKDENGIVYFIAEPEKAVVDFLYLNLRKITMADKDIFEESYRFQNAENLKGRKLKTLADLFCNSKLTKAVELFCEFIKGERT